MEITPQASTAGIISIRNIAYSMIFNLQETVQKVTCKISKITIKIKFSPLRFFVPFMCSKSSTSHHKAIATPIPLVATAKPTSASPILAALTTSPTLAKLSPFAAPGTEVKSPISPRYQPHHSQAHSHSHPLHNLFIPTFNLHPITSSCLNSTWTLAIIYKSYSLTACTNY